MWHLMVQNGYGMGSSGWGEVECFKSCTDPRIDVIHVIFVVRLFCKAAWPNVPLWLRCGGLLVGPLGQRPMGWGQTVSQTPGHHPCGRW